MTYLRNEIAKLANINVETLRYYERNGLIPPPMRDINGYRLYSNDTIERLEIIKYAKSCGYTLEETKRIIGIVASKEIDYKSIIDFIDEKLLEIDQKRDQLDSMKLVLNKIKGNIDSQIQCPIKTTFKEVR